MSETPKLTLNQAKERKPRKYNPKPNKVCVGQFLVSLYTHLQKILTECEGTRQDKYAAAWAMNMTMMEVCLQWCRCPWCKATGAKIEEMLSKPQEKSKESDEKNE